MTESVQRIRVLVYLSSLLVSGTGSKLILLTTAMILGKIIMAWKWSGSWLQIFVATCPGKERGSPCNCRVKTSVPQGWVSPYLSQQEWKGILEQVGIWNDSWCRTSYPDPHCCPPPPHTLRVQGSVENANQHVKNIIVRATIEAKLQDSQRDIGWVEVLGPATSAMNNSACSSSIKGLTPYRHASRPFHSQSSSCTQIKPTLIVQCESYE